MLNQLSYDHFKPYLKQCFTLDLEDQASLVLELIEVSHVGAEPAADEDRIRAFSLVFCGPETPSLPQRIYSLKHEKLGSLDLFLVPIGTGKAGMRYEAVFT